MEKVIASGIWWRAAPQCISSPWRYVVTSDRPSYWAFFAVCGFKRSVRSPGSEAGRAFCSS